MESINPDSIKEPLEASTIEYSDEEQEQGIVSKYLVAPWNLVKQEIIKTLPSSIKASSLIYPSAIEKPGVTKAPIIIKKNNGAQEPVPQKLPQTPIYIQHGFQLTRTILHPNESLNKLLYQSNVVPDTFLTADDKKMYEWKAKKRTRNIDVSDTKHQNSMSGLNKWIFIEKWKVICISTTTSDIKILGMGLEVKDRISSPKAVLHFEFDDKSDQLIVSGPSNIRIYTFKRDAKNGEWGTVFGTCRLTITDLESDQWVSSTVLFKTGQKLFAAVDNNVFVYNYQTGERVNNMLNIHSKSITCMSFVEGNQCLVTGSKDCCVRVWNSAGYLVQEFKEHPQKIMSIANPILGDALNGLSTFVLSCYYDGTVCLWNIETGYISNKMETMNDILGLGVMKKDTFYFYTKKGIQIYFISRSWRSFTFNGATAKQLTRHASRILVGGQDGTLQLISPANGALLVTGYPVMRDIEMKMAVCDISNERIWSLLSNGDISVYNCHCNPMKISAEWKFNPINEKCSVLSTFITKTSDIHRETRSSNTPEFFTFILGGTEAGQIVRLDPDGNSELLLQAHTNSITILQTQPLKKRIITAAKDSTIKIWSVAINESTNLGKFDDRLLNNSIIYKFSFTLDCIITLDMGFYPVFSHVNERVDEYFYLGVVTNLNGMLVYCVSDEAKKIGNPKIHAKDDDHSDTVTGLTGNSTYDIFATSSLDGTVKIWNGIENILLREIVFSQPSLSITFNNERGDLIVGLNDQIAIIYMQDYLPFNSLRLAIELDFEDDIIEVPDMFNPNIDIWEVYHSNMKKDESYTESVVVKKKKHIDSRVTRSLAEKRRLRRQFLLGEKRAFKTVKDYEKSEFPEFSDDDIEKLPEVSTHQLNEPTTNKNSDYHKFDPSEFEYKLEMRKRSVKSPTTTPKQINFNSTAAMYKTEIPRYISKPQVSQVVRGTILTREEALAKIHHYQQLLNPYKYGDDVRLTTQTKYGWKKKFGTIHEANATKLPAAALEKIRKKKLHEEGGIEEIEEGKSDGENDSDQSYDDFEEETVTSDGGTVTVIKVKKRHRKKRTTDSAMSKTLAERLLNTKKKIVQESKKKIAALLEDAPENEKEEEKIEPPKVEEIEPEQEEIIKPQVEKIVEHLLSDDSDSEVDREPESESDEDVVINKKTSESKKLIQKPAKPTKKKVIKEVIVARNVNTPESEAESVISIPESLKEEPQPEHEPEIEPQTQPETEAQPEPEPGYSDTEKNSVTRVITPPTPILAPTRKTSSNRRRSSVSVDVNFLKMQELISKIPIPKTPPPAPKKKIVAEVVFAELDSKGRDKFLISQEQVVAKATWNFLKEVSMMKEMESVDLGYQLSNLTTASWFPGLQGKELNLANIIDVLLNLIKEGNAFQKIEALKVIGALYRSFKRDFTNPNNMIEFILEATIDKDPEVRTTACKTFGMMEIYNPDAIYNLVCLLDDKDPAVKQAASEALRALGITSKYILKNLFDDLAKIEKSRNITSKITNSTRNSATTRRNSTRRRSIMPKIPLNKNSATSSLETTFEEANNGSSISLHKASIISLPPLPSSVVSCIDLVPYKSTYLDELLAKSRERKLEKCKSQNQMITYYLSEQIDRRVFGRKIGSRPSSVVATMCFVKNEEKRIDKGSLNSLGNDFI